MIGVPQVSLQLHATLDDFVDLVKEWVEAEGVEVAARRQSSRWVVVSPGELHSPPSDFASVTQIILSQKPLVGERAEPDDLSGNLVIHVGSLTADGLRESAMGAISETDDDLELWRRLIRRTRSLGHAGATVVNPETGDRQRVPSHRHLNGAHELAARAVPMLAAAGWIRFEFDDLN